MSIQDLGSLGEVLAALATLATLLYLATQVRQNTRALKSATFENISSEMGKNLEPIMSSHELSAIFIKGMGKPELLTGEERLRLSSIYVSSFRKLESVYVQHELGSLDMALTKGFEYSILKLLDTKYGREWWNTAKDTFYKPFVEHVNSKLPSKISNLPHPSVAIQGNIESNKF